MLWNPDTSTYYLIKWGVNMRGPYFEDLLEKYEQNIIIGKSVSMVTVSLVKFISDYQYDFTLLPVVIVNM